VIRVEPAGFLAGHIAVPGDKSISHRSVLIGALADGETQVRGFGRSADTQSTIDAVRALGVQVDDIADDELVVHGVGLRGLRQPDGPIDAGNAGTLMRLLPGILAGQEGRFELTGDESLRARPMDRVAEPLKRMGARIETTNGRPPVVVAGTDEL
jgi:3-phosphoshikimate 1-carboxyvinyltransferase